MVSEKLLLTSYLDKHHHHKQLTPFSYELPVIYKSSVIILVNSLIHLDQRCDLVGSCKYVIQFIFLVIHLD